MNQTLQAGGNVSINDFSGTVIISHDIDHSHDINLTAFLLTDAGKVQGDHGIVFFNQPREQNGAATFMSPTQSGNTKTHRIDFDLRKIPTGINKIAVTLSEENRNSFSSVRNLKAEVRSGNDIVQLNPSSFNAENGIIVLELYVEETARRQEEARQQEIAAREAQERRRKEQRRANLTAKYGDRGNQLDAMIERYGSGSRFESLIDKHNGNIDVLTKIMNRELWIGQTQMQLLDARGNPADKYQKIMATKTREIWKYHQIGANRFRLRITLENGVVVGWDEK